MAPETDSKALHLPNTAARPVDVSRLARELQELQETLLQLGLRRGGQEVKLPKTSHLMDQLCELNRLNLLQEADRKRLKQFLEQTKTSAPVLHISFSADPAPRFLEQLMTWLRRELHPSLLITVGMQPSIGAGCIVRSTNKQFDFSLRQDFAAKRQLLIDKLSEGKRP